MQQDYPASSTEPVCSRPVDAMTNDYRAELERIIDAHDADEGMSVSKWTANLADAMDRARALLDQPVAEGPKPVVDYSRVPEIATEAQIRSAAQYLVKKRNCDGDLIPAIEYAIARWGCPTAQPVPEPVAPTDEEIMELMPQQMRDDLAAAARALGSTTAVGWINVAMRIILNRHAVDHARAVLNKWGNSQGILDSSPQPVAVSERLPNPEDTND